jgi:hypothetical protein
VGERKRVIGRAELLQMVLALSLLSGRLLAQETPGPAASGSGPEVRLEVHDGKSQFYLGERIELDLVFRNTTSDPYMLNGSIYGDMSDKVEIAPTSGWVQWRGRSGHDYASITELDSNGVRLPVVLNEGFVFREPGHYEIRVTTDRLKRGSDVRNIKADGPVTTNAVGIDLVPMPADVESEQVKSLMSAIGSANTQTREGSEAHREAVSRLAALEGDDALRAKIRLIQSEDDDVRQVMDEALAATRNLALQLSLLEAAWKDPATDPIYDMPEALQETRALMRGQILPGWVMAAAADNSPEAAKAKQEHIADMEDLLRTLPMRSGESRAEAAYYLMQDRGLPAGDLAAARPVAIGAFSSMNDTEQHMLLEGAWPAIRDPALTPLLRAMLDRTPADRDAIRRLIELDPGVAKDYVVRAVCDRESFVTLNDVGALPEATLPEVDGCLGDLLRVPPPRPSDHVWKTRAELAARFASPAILPAVRQGWTDATQDSAVLPLLLRYAPSEAILRIEASKDESVVLFFETNQVFKGRGVSFPPELRNWLRERVRSAPEGAAGTAGYELSQGGAPGDRSLLEQRLAKLRAEWSTRADDVASAGPGTPAASARKLDLELMSDLRGATVWTLSDSEAARLALGCLSDECRLYGKPRGDNENSRAN